MKLVNDLAGAIFDVLKLVGYFIAGAKLVGGPLYLIAKLFEFIL